MDSSGSTLTLSTKMMPFMAILRHELRSLWSSWLVRLWLIGSVLLTLLILASQWATEPTADVIKNLLFPYLVLPWFVLVMVLGISPVTGSRLEALADGILSRPVTRFEYLLASWAARVVMVLAIYLVVIVPAVTMVAFAERPPTEDKVTFYGTFAAICIVGLVLTFQVSLGFLMGTLLRRPMVAAVILVFAWVPINLIPYAYSVEEFSPISLDYAIPVLLRTGAVNTPDPHASARETVIRVLKGEWASPKPDKSNPSNYKDFSLIRVILGYGIPTLIAIGLATFCFCRRDL